MRKLALLTTWLLVFSIPIERAAILPGIGTLPRAVGLLAFAVALAAVLMTHQIRRPSLGLVLAALFVGWTSMSIYWSVDPEVSNIRIKTMWQLLVLAWLLWEFGATPTAQRLLMQAYVLGCTVLGLTIVGNVLTGALGGGRGTAFGRDANDVGLTLAIGIPIAWYLLQQRDSAFQRRLGIIYVPLAVLAVLLTASRGAFVAMAVALAIIPWSLSRMSLRGKVVTALIAGIGMVAAVSLVPQKSWRRLAQGRAEVVSGDLSYRFVIWRAGVNEFTERPVAGSGAGTFGVQVAQVLGRGFAAHNTYLSVAVDVGLVGFVLLFGFGGTVMHRARSLSLWDRRLAVALAATWSAGVMSLSWEHQKPTWFLVGLLAALVGTALPAESAPNNRRSRRRAAERRARSWATVQVVSDPPASLSETSASGPPSVARQLRRAKRKRTSP